MSIIHPNTDEAGKSLEAFSRDMVVLVKAVRAFPDGGPSSRDICERLAGWSLHSGAGEAVIHVTPEGLEVNGIAYGGGGTRTGDLAALFFSSGVGAFCIAGGSSADEVRSFASLLANHDQNSDESFIEKVEESGIRWITVDLTGGPKETNIESPPPSQEVPERIRRVQNAWMDLQASPADKRAVARALSTSELWEVGDSDGAFQLASALCGLGDVYDTAASIIVGEERSALDMRGKALTRLLREADFDKLLKPGAANGRLDKGFISAMLEVAGIQGITESAARAIESDGPESRTARVLADWAAARDLDATLKEIKTRLAETVYANSSDGVWRNLETLVLEISGNADNTAKSEQRPAKVAEYGSVRSDINFKGEPESNLDHVFIALAMAGGGGKSDGWEALFARIKGCVQGGNPSRGFSVADKIDQITPFALDSKPEILFLLVDSILADDSKPTADDRRKFTAFVNKHREKLAEQLVTRLAEANRASHRKMLVEALSGLNRDATPMLVTRARRGPWYLTRNLLIVLGRRGDPASLPYIVTATDNSDERVARQALRSVAEFGAKGADHLQKISQDEKRSAMMRGLAKKMLERVAR